MNQLTLDLQPEPEYRTIPLTRGQFTTVDTTDYDWLITSSGWQAAWDPKIKKFYAVGKPLPNPDGSRRKLIKMHRFITGAPVESVVDHRDRDTLNNRRGNLRVATIAQNAHNTGRSSNNTTGFKGVFRSRGKYMAMISVHGKRLWLGYHLTAEQAHAAYSAAAKQHFGEFGAAE